MGILMSPEDKARWNEICDGLKEAITDFIDEMNRRADEARAAFGKLAEEQERPDYLEQERAGWRSAAAFARSRMAARAQAFSRQMVHQKARQAMKRRKLLHSEGSFPDVAR